MPKPEIIVIVCTNNRPSGHPRGSCWERGSPSVLQRFFDEAERKELFPRVAILGSTCIGPCEHGPTVIVFPGPTYYGKVGEDDVAEIVDSHICGGKPVERLLMPDACWS